MALIHILQGWLKRKRPGDGDPSDFSILTADSQVLDPASGLTSSTFGGESTLSVPGEGTLPPSMGPATASAPLEAPGAGAHATDRRQRVLVVTLAGVLVATGAWGVWRWNQIAHTPGDATTTAVLAASGRLADAAARVVATDSAASQAQARADALRQRTDELMEHAEALLALRLQQGAGPAEVNAAVQGVRLLSRIAQLGQDAQAAGGDAATQSLQRELGVWKEIVAGQLNGSGTLRLPAVRDARQRELLERLSQGAAPLDAAVQALVQARGAAAEARAAREALQAPADAARQALADARTRPGGEGGAQDWLVPAGAAILVLLCALALVRLQTRSGRERAALAERQRAEARAQEKEVRRVNDATQAAILRLMNELQDVAEGDLTRQATVTEDITGAIADSINYTVEELRTLVGQVQDTSQQVAQTTGTMENSAIELLAASTEQLREIRETGQAVLEMARRIQDVSTQAQASAAAADRARRAAGGGRQAMQDAMDGMNQIRDQIQDTAKRIKRLGESSQEIGEITELISDITGQTNVLALNAAIQAAGAGEAGRGFAIVAEEVQRLAERSADATRQIAQLVRAIQADTQDAVAAMEASTRGVVEGARLSDNAGEALAEIDQLARQVAELVEQIALSAAREAELASGTAGNIQHIFAVTEQTGEGTRTTVQQVRELTRMADALRQSVARFKL